MDKLYLITFSAIDARAMKDGFAIFIPEDLPLEAKHCPHYRAFFFIFSFYLQIIFLEVFNAGSRLTRRAPLTFSIHSIRLRDLERGAQFTVRFLLAFRISFILGCEPTIEANPQR
jgi:hypothetical protein